MKKHQFDIKKIKAIKKNSDGVLIHQIPLCDENMSNSYLLNSNNLGLNQL